MKRLAILGASGHGKVVADCAEAAGWLTVVFFDDAWPTLQENGQWPVVGNTQTLLEQLEGFDGVLVAIGNNTIRQAKLEQLLAAGAVIPVLKHPTSIVSAYANLGPGTVVFAGAVVNTDADIGAGSIINTGATVDHDCVLGACVHVSPGAHLAGAVQAGDLSWVGIGASVIQCVRIGQAVMVGAGAAVVGDVADHWTVAGVPAKRIQ